MKVNFDQEITNIEGTPLHKLPVTDGQPKVDRLT